MQIARRLKAHRTEYGLSQEELAQAIFVSRQTISNWETDRTYPDVQSLLLLSDLFETSIDELVKGDVDIMEKTVENDWKLMSRLGIIAWCLVGVGFVCLVVGFAVPSGPSSLAPKFTESELLGLVLFFALWLLGMAVISVVEYLKKKNDLVTYREIVAYSRGEEPVRDKDSFGRKHLIVSAWIKFALCALLGALLGLMIVRLFG